MLVRLCDSAAGRHFAEGYNIISFQKFYFAEQKIHFLWQFQAISFLRILSMQILKNIVAVEAFP